MHTHCYKNGTVMMSAISDYYLCSLCSERTCTKSDTEQRSAATTRAPMATLRVSSGALQSWCVKYTGRTPNGRIKLYPKSSEADSAWDESSK